MINLDIHELRAVIFACTADLETVVGNIVNFVGDDEPLLSALQKLSEELLLQSQTKL